MRDGRAEGLQMRPGTSVTHLCSVDPDNTFFRPAVPAQYQPVEKDDVDPVIHFREPHVFPACH